MGMVKWESGYGYDQLFINNYGYGYMHLGSYPTGKRLCGYWSK